MGQSVTLTAMVISAANVGDFDKRLVLLTRERGRISAFARGARKPNSPFVAVCQPFSFGQFTLYEGRTSYNLMQAQVDNYFMELKQDLEGVYLGMYFCEIADYLTRENNDEAAILKLLYQSLKALTKESIPNQLIRYIYEIKVLAYYGLAMQTFQCAVCSKEEDLSGFESHLGGVVCTACLTKAPGHIRISESTLYALQFILSAEIEKLYTFTVSDQVMRELRRITRQYFDVYVEKKFKTLDFIQV